MQLTAIDYGIIGLYFLICLLVGLVFTSRAGKSLSEYFVSGRQFPWWVAGTSMVATTFAADTPLVVTGLVIQQGVAGNWFWWSLAISGSLTVFLFAKLWRRSEVLTDVELIELRYGGAPAAFLRGFRACYVAVVVNSVIIAWVTSAMLKIVKDTMPAAWVQSAGDWWIIAALLAMVGFYSTLSGLWGVALTDVIQFVIAIGGCIALAVFAVQHVGGIESLQQKVIDVAGPGHLSFIPDLTSPDSPLPWHIFVLLICVQWWATWFPGAEPGGGGYVVQRMNSCINEKHAVWATLWFQMAHYCLRPWPWILVALVAMVTHPELLTAKHQDIGYIIVMRELAPVGLRGLMIAAFFAAYMSTISTQMNWGASYLVRDVYQRFVAPDADEHKLVSASRIASVLVLVLGGIASWIFRDYRIDDMWRMLAALGAGTGLVFMLRWWWWRISAWTEISAMVLSLITYVLISSRRESLNQLAGFELQETHVMAIVAALTLIATFIVTMLLPPERPQTLSNFYCRVRPPAWGWGEIAAQHPDVKPEGNFGLALGLALLSAGMIYLTLPAVGHWIFGNYLWATLCTLGAVACGIVIARGMNRITAT
ncbi:MAG: sodium:solute symporter family protein [Pirellulales bacterium]